MNDRAWKFCPNGYICKTGTNLVSLNSNPCPKGKFCLFGMQSEKDTFDCPSGNSNN
jgi:hypothetical protein